MRLTPPHIGAAAALLVSTPRASSSSLGFPHPDVSFDCSSGCLDRSSHTITSVVHGVKGDPFWEGIRTSSIRAAEDMGVGFEMELREKYDPKDMAEEIRQYAANREKGMGGLLVTIPNGEVADAVQEAVDKGVPVVGINSGAILGKLAGTVDYVAPDDLSGGKLAGETLLELAKGRGYTSGLSALYVDGADGNRYSEERLEGFRDSLKGAQLERLAHATVQGGASDEERASAEKKLTERLVGCPFQMVLVSGPNVLDAVFKAYEVNGCSIETSSLGTFETSEEIYAAIGNDRLDFTIDNQHHLQGSLGTVLAALVVTKRKSLAPSGDDESGAYLSGPKRVTKFDLPTDTVKVCQAEAFPVCPGKESDRCACTDRSKIKIGGVTHGVSTDAFWDPIYAAASQAASDLGVELINERFDAGDAQGSDVLHARMANRIEELCVRRDVDGLFVSIPSEAVLQAIEACQKLNVPVMSINAGNDESKDLGLQHHIGQVDYNAGKSAGERLVAAGIEKGVCANHAKGVSVVEDRCAGFEAALVDANVTYLGQAYVPDDNEALYIELVEGYVVEQGDWDGVGFLAAGGPQHGPALELKKRHPEMTIGAIDTSADLFDAIDRGDVLFGIDQEPYLQGYMPVVLLAYEATTGQQVSNHVIESGPAFVESTPSEAEQVCHEISFEACQPETTVSAESTSNLVQSGSDAGLIAGICILAVALVVAVMFLMHRINVLKRHIAKLEAQGQSVNVSAGQKMLSIFKSVDRVVPAVEVV